MILYHTDGSIIDTSIFNTDKDAEKELNMATGSLYRLKNNKMHHSQGWYVDKSKIPPIKTKPQPKTLPPELTDNYIILSSVRFSTQCKKCNYISHQTPYMMKQKDYRCGNCEMLEIKNEILSHNYNLLNETPTNGDWYTECKSCGHHQYQTITALRNKDFRCSNCELQQQIKNIQNTEQYDILNEFPLQIRCRNCGEIHNTCYAVLEERDFRCTKCYSYEQIQNIQQFFTIDDYRNSKYDLTCDNCGGVHKQIPYFDLHKRNFECKHCKIDRDTQTKNIILSKGFSLVSHFPLTVECGKCGHEFQRNKSLWLNGVTNCPKCDPKLSDLELMMIELLNKNNIPPEWYIVNRSLQENGIYVTQLDFYFPQHKFAIEVNGLAYHTTPNTKGKILEKDKHQIKYLQCKELGIHLMQFNSQDMFERLHVIESMVVNKLNLTPNKIYARKCTIKNVNKNEADVFLESSHIQGATDAYIRVGLFLEDKLVAYMSFSENHKLTRYCQKTFTNVIGGFSKLLKYYIKNYNPPIIETFSDNMYSYGDVYKNNGFEIQHKVAIGYKYAKKGEYNKLYRREPFMKKNIRLGYNPLNLDWKEEWNEGCKNNDCIEEVIANKNGYFKYHDAGKIKWVYRVS